MIETITDILALICGAYFVWFCIYGARRIRRDYRDRRDRRDQCRTGNHVERRFRL